MKTSVAKKLRDRVLAAFLAIAVMLSYVLPSAITASAAEGNCDVVKAYGDGNEYSGQLNFSQFELSYTGEDGQKHFLVEENKEGKTPSIGKSTEFTFLFDWDIAPGSALEKALNDAFKNGKQFEMVCDLSEELSGFSFGDSLVTGKTVTITDGDGTLSVTFSFEGTTLHIHVNEKGDRTTNYKGQGEMSGSISLEKEDCATNGEAELKFFDKECKVIVSDYAPDVNVVKESGGIVEKDGDLYFKFRTVITAKNAADDIYLDDEFTYNGMPNTWGGTANSIFDGDKLEDITVTAPDGSSVSVDVQENANGKARLHFDSIEEGETVVEYLIKANPASNDNSTNHAYIKDSSETVLSQDDAWVMIQTPQVSKSNGGLKDGDEVEWTITVEKNVLDTLKDSKDFTVTDKPQAGIDEASMQAAMDALGAAGSFADGYEIPFEAFKKQEDGSYTVSYTTKVTEDFLNTLSGKTVANKVTAEFEDLIDVPDDTFKGESDLRIDGIGEIDVTKEMYASKGGVFSWRSTIKVPRCDLDMIEINDESAWNLWDGKTYVKHRVLPESITVNGKPLKDVAAEDSFTDSKEFASYKFGFKLSDEYIEELNSELADDADEFVITIEYNTQVVDEDGNFVDEYDPLNSITNKMSVKAQAKNEDIPVDKKVTCTVDPEFRVNKQSVDSWASNVSTEGLTNPLIWRVNIGSYDNIAADKIFEEGKVITVTDTLPKGYELGDYVLCIGDSQYSFDHTTKDGVQVTKTVDKDSRQVVTFEVTVTEDILKHLKQGEWSTSPRTTWDLAIEYSTGMTEEYAAEFMMTHKNGDTVSFVNSADVFYDGGLIGNNLEATGNVTVKINDILDKQLIEAGAEGKYAYDDQGAYVLFKITLNPDELPIGGYDENGNLLYETITAEDILGTSMTYGGDVTGLLDGDEVKVSKSGRKLQFILKNKTAYVITYKARIVGTKDTLTSEEEAERYSNVVAITCNNITSDNTSATVEASVYKVVLSVSGDTERAYFTISGTKTWDDNGNVYRPDHITLKMVRHNLTDKNAEDEEFTITVGKAFDCDVTLEEDEIDGNRWSFTVDEPSLLYTRLGDIKYSYSITEATDNKGYTLKNITADLNGITNDDIGNPKEIELEITNEMVKTSVTIEKKWVGGDDTNRPDVTVTLNGTDGYSKKYTLNDDKGWTVTVEDLPKYDSEGNEITYSVTEAAVDHYNSVVTNVGDDFTVTNTYVVENTEIKVTKVWEGDLEKYGLDKKEVTVHLYQNGTEYGGPLKLNKDNDWTDSFKALPKTDNDGNEYVYTVKEDVPQHFTADTKQTGNTFTITNTVDRESFKTSLTVTKKWAENIGYYDLDKQPVTVYLTENGKKTKTSIELNEGNSWTHTFTDLLKYDADGEEIKYSVEEVSIEGFNSTVTTDDDGNVTITNTVDYSKFKTSVSGVKTWSDDNDKLGLRPDSVMIELYANNIKVNTCTTDEAHGWKYSFDDLDTKDPLTDKTIVYTVKEADVEYYSATVDGYNITNTLDTAKATVRKLDDESMPVKGAHLQLFDKDNNKIADWTTNGTDEEIDVVVGMSYRLHEESAPEGYTKADDITFVAKDGENLWTMTDKKKEQTSSEQTQPTPVETPTKTPTNTPTNTPTKTPTNTPTNTPTKTPTNTPTNTPTKTPTNTPTNTPTKTPTNTPTNTPTKTPTNTPTNTPTKTPTNTPTNTPTKTPTNTPTNTPTKTPTNTPTNTPTKTPTNTPTNTPTGTSQTNPKPEEPKPTKVQISKKDITGGKELAGAKLKVVDKDGNVIKEWTSTDKPTYFENVFKAGETYTLIEETAPDGYVAAEEVEFTVSEDGSIDVVEMFDDTTKVQISKQDLTTGKELAGAKLKVVDKDGNVIKEWTSTDKPTYFENVFKAGETYTLIEETAPDGYVKAEEVEFTVSEDGSIDVVEMFDDTTKVQISKKDITGGKELAGAKLKVVDKDGNTIKEWTSTDKPTYFENVFKAGETYTLIEETAPDGYVKAEEVEFTVSEDGSIDVVEMFDDTTKVQISKQDLTTGKELAGAKLKVVDKDGNTIKEWTSTDKPTYFENVFKAGETYTLIEETAPDGYVVAEEVKFTVSSDGSIDKVVMKDDVTKVSISKKDITGDGELAGAKLKVLDKDGNVIDEWTSTDKPTYFENVFKAGETYTLIEETAPDGYVAAEEVEFTVSEDGSIDVVEMFDDTTKVQISKQDLTTGKELAGAKLKVVDKDGNTIKEWTSTDKPTYFENVFKAGETYTLIEETAPDGYVAAEEVEFTVSEDGSIDVVEMFDDTTKVQISKKDITGGKELAGAKLKVVDKDGNTIKEWTSTDKPTYFENVFKAGETYTLIEETAPDGYVAAEEVEFTVSEDGSIDVVEMFDDTTKVQISKQDLTTGKELAGAKLKVVDKDGNTIKEWTSTDKPTYFENVFKAGETYTLIEETAPDGYVAAEEVEFTVSEDGSIDVVEMFDDTTKVQISKQDLTTGKELAGAKLKVVDKDGNVIKEWTSTDKPTYFENVFKAGETYTLIEETAPDGYVVAEEVKFTVSSDGSIDKVVMKDDVTKVSISKKDITGDGELVGAKLKVVDKDGNTIKEWTSTDKPTYFENVFKAGETYTLIEETAPDGYVAAEEVEFTVSEDGSIDVVEMFDDTTKVQISKQDLTTGKELAGAKLKVVDKDGNTIKEWTSTDKPTYFENVFKAGETYTLIEETAPDGYVVAEEVKFTVSSDGSIDKVVMKDDVTKVSISKKDITGDGELVGAKLKVLDKDGNVIDEWTSTDKPHEINGKLVAGQTYILHEEVAPDGYKVASDIEFVVNADGTVTKVTMIDEAKNGTGLDGDTNDKDSGVAQGGGSNDKDKNTGTNDKSPVTGDSSNVTLALAVMALGMVLVANRKRRNH